MNGGLSMVEMKSGYKMTEVGVIPEDWEVCELKNHLVLLTDYDANGSFADMASNVVTTTGNGYAWYVRATDLEQQSSLSEVKYVDEKSYRFLRKSTLYGGEVLLAKRGEIGKVYYFQMKTKRATLAPNLYLLKLKDTINSYFLFSLFKSTFGQNLLKSINASTSLGAIYKDDVKGLNILIPPFEEQASIATALSDVDSLISALTKKIEKKKAIKLGLMQQLLTGKKRLPGFGDVWDVVQLKRIISEFIVPMRDKPTALTGPIPWCRIEDFDGKYLKKSLSNQGVDLNTVSKMNLKIFPVNTLLVSCSANLGRCAIVKQKLVTNQTFIGLVPSDRIDVEFLYYKMSREDKNLNNMATGTTISYLSREQFENYEILIPSSKAEQTAIANILSDCDSEIAALEEKRDKYKEIKQGMMQQLLTGKIRLIK